MVFGLIGLIIFKIIDKIPKREKKFKENILFSYIKAKKEKVCPRIEFIYDKK